MFDFKPPEAKGPVRVLKGGMLIDGNGGKPVKDPVIVLEGRRIKAVGTKGKVKIPAKAEIIDCGTATLLPGLMDMHVHITGDARLHGFRRLEVSLLCSVFSGSRLLDLH